MSLRSFFTRSIGRRLTVINLLVSTAALLMMCSAFVSYQFHSFRQSVIHNMTTLGDVLGANSTAALAFGDRASAEETLAALIAIDQVICSAIYGPDGSRFASYTRDGGPVPATIPVNQVDQCRVEGTRLHLTCPIRLRGERVGTIYLQSEVDSVSHLLRQNLRAIAVWLLGAFTLAFLLSTILQRSISRPILRLAQTARVVSLEGNYALRAAPGRRDEVGTLIECFNEMLAQIQKRDLELADHRAHLEDVVEARTAELIQINAELREASIRAETAAQTKGQFLANMSHEIRTPMNAILGLTELTLSTTLSNEQRDYLQMVHTSADSLLNIINDILDLSKIEAGKLLLDPREFSLRECLEKTLKGLSLRAHQKHLELVCHVRPEVPDQVYGDDLRIQQVVVNLVGNAIKFTPSGEVVARVERVRQEGNLADLLISVIDTGIGIPEEKQRAIFEAFSQADGSTTRRFGGTGLGLAISAQLVSLMGGRIRVTSREGEGSRFDFSLRLPVAPSVIPAQPPMVGGRPIVVADDNPSSRNALCDLVTTCGMEVTEAGDAASLLDLLRAWGDFGGDLPAVILDAGLSAGGGAPLVLELRDRQIMPPCLILLLPALAGAMEAAEYEAMGVSACLIKPAGREEVRQAIESALGRVTAPAVGQTTPDERQPSAEAKPKAVGRILLVEDNPINQRLAVLLLQRRGYEVQVAGDGRAAVQVVQTNGCDLILMDLHMPVMGGIEATMAIRRLEAGRGRRVPIIALTADAMKGVEDLCFDAGMDAYLSKPLRPAELYTQIERLLNESKTTGPNQREAA